MTNVVTLVAPFLARIEAQLDDDIACLLQHVVAQRRWEAELNEPLLVLLAEHYRAFNAWRPERVGQ